MSNYNKRLSNYNSSKHTYASKMSIKKNLFFLELIIEKAISMINNLLNDEGNNERNKIKNTSKVSNISTKTF